MKAHDLEQDKEAVKTRAPYLFCDVCAYYPMEPVHGHFMCPSCHAVTKCCELGPMTMEGGCHEGTTARRDTVRF